MVRRPLYLWYGLVYGNDQNCTVDYDDDDNDDDDTL